MVQDNVLSKVKNEKLMVFVVWAKVLANDSAETAKVAAKIITDRRATQYWDSSWASANLFGKTVTLPEKKTRAWDIYFGYNSGLEWAASPPGPTAWAHQLGLDARHLMDGKKLREAVEKLK
ncbi:MAG: hypothetical protein HND42_04465 [Armatimonadetes bacterium]|nr:hypothetical protein [Armatimonadota bacterium]NOG92485.1 hypothetical protein [Armatimonadota bacterium]